MYRRIGRKAGWVGGRDKIRKGEKRVKKSIGEFNVKGERVGGRERIERGRDEIQKEIYRRIGWWGEG